MADILLLGADRERAQGLKSLLRQDGHAVTWLRSVELWRESERAAAPELVVAATPNADAILAARAGPARGFPAPLLFVQHDADPFRDVHLEDRLIDRMESPFMAEEFLARVDALVRVRRVVLRTETAWPAWKKASTGWRARLASLLGSRVPRYAKPTGPYYEVASRAAAWSDRRDTFEPGHSERVSALAAMIADGLGLPDGEAATLLRASMLHDIGKIAMPIEILRRRGPLEADQLRLVRTHPERGAALLRALDKDEAVAEAVLFHHERVDGSGYYGRKGSDIPRTASILAVAETYDAMTTTLVREQLSSDTALAILKDRQEHFQPDCVAMLAEAIRPRPARVPLSSLRWP